MATLEGLAKISDWASFIKRMNPKRVARLRDDIATLEGARDWLLTWYPYIRTKAGALALAREIRKKEAVPAVQTPQQTPAPTAAPAKAIRKVAKKAVQKQEQKPAEDEKNWADRALADPFIAKASALILRTHDAFYAFGVLFLGVLAAVWPVFWVPTAVLLIGFVLLAVVFRVSRARADDQKAQAFWFWAALLGGLALLSLVWAFFPDQAALLPAAGWVLSLLPWGIWAIVFLAAAGTALVLWFTKKPGQVLAAGVAGLALALTLFSGAGVNLGGTNAKVALTIDLALVDLVLWGLSLVVKPGVRIFKETVPPAVERRGDSVKVYKGTEREKQVALPNRWRKVAIAFTIFMVPAILAIWLLVPGPSGSEAPKLTKPAAAKGTPTVTTTPNPNVHWGGKVVGGTTTATATRTVTATVNAMSTTTSRVDSTMGVPTGTLSTATPTNTPGPTATPTSTSSVVVKTTTATVPVPTATPTKAKPSDTPVPPTATVKPPEPTRPPEPTKPPAPTNTPVPPTNTAVPPTNTPANTPTNTPANTPANTPTNTSVPPTATPTQVKPSR